MPRASRMAQKFHTVQAVYTFQCLFCSTVLAYDLAGPSHMPGHRCVPGHGSGIGCASGFKNGAGIRVFEAPVPVQTSNHLSPMAQASMWLTNRTAFCHQCDLGIAYGPGIHMRRASDVSSYQTWLGHRIWPRHSYVSGIADGSGSGFITCGMDVASDMAQASTQRHPCVSGIGSVQVSHTVRASDVAWASEWPKHPDHPGISNGSGTGFCSDSARGPGIHTVLATDQLQASDVPHRLKRPRQSYV